jgi:hypothetical protein
MARDRHRLTPEASTPDPDAGHTITARLNDGPLKGERLEAEIVQGRPPFTIDAPADDGTTCRYTLADWAQSGPSAAYTFLYRL